MSFQKNCVSYQQNNIYWKGSWNNWVGTAWPTVYFLCFLAFRHDLCSVSHATFTGGYLHQDFHMHQRPLHLYNTRVQSRTETNASDGDKGPFRQGSKNIPLYRQKQGLEGVNLYGRKSLPGFL